MFFYYLLFAHLVVIHEDLLHLFYMQIDPAVPIQELLMRSEVFIVGAITTETQEFLKKYDLDSKVNTVSDDYFRGLISNDFQLPAGTSEVLKLKHYNNYYKAYPIQLLPQIKDSLMSGDFEIWTPNSEYFNFYPHQRKVDGFADLLVVLNNPPALADKRTVNQKQLMILDLDNTLCRTYRYYDDQAERNRRDLYCLDGAKEFVLDAAEHFDVYVVSSSSENVIAEQLEKLGLENVLSPEVIIGYYRMICLKAIYIHSYGSSDDCFEDYAVFLKICYPNPKWMPERNAAIESCAIVVDNNLPLKKVLVAIPMIESRILMKDFVIVDGMSDEYKSIYGDNIKSVEDIKDEIAWMKYHALLGETVDKQKDTLQPSEETK
eukprot:NODE_83_length_22684_cov_0.307934.p4 type:complete len:376 gc:universal NODE_83_length_22684_cov_0.307934:12992-11865(-)